MIEHNAPVARDGEALQQLRLPWMLAFFVLSGVSGLIYQSLWSQYLALLLGSSAYAQSLVLSIFMGGMAAGAWIAAHLLARLRNLLLAYAWIEGLIGLAGLGFHLVFLALTHWLYTRWMPELQSSDAVTLTRWLLAAVLIAPQTILLGMTFPIMSAGLMRWLPEQAGSVLGGLYFYNSIGAAAGALLATFVLVPAAGLAGAMAFAGLLNLLILAGVYLARVPDRGSDRAPTQHQLGVRAAEPATLSTGRGFARAILAIACVTGLSSFMYEVGWIRMLSLVMGSSQHAFELMLAAFIGGLALGGLHVKSRLDRVQNPIRYAAIVQLLMGLAALATLPLYDHAFVALSALMDTFAPTSRGYALYTVFTAVIAIVIMMPAAFFAGMTLPVLTYVLLRRGEGERAVGKVYAVNTLGAILGVLLMVHVGMPMLGLKLAMVVAAGLDLVLGLVLLGMAGGATRSRSLLAAGALSGVGVVAAMLLADFDPMRLHSGVYRSRLTELGAERTVFYSADGKTASIALHGMEGQSLTIATNGKPDASLNVGAGLAPTPDEPTMILAALLGIAANPDSAQAAVIGFGSGLTTHVLSQNAGFESITTVEIEPKMVEAARGFGAAVAGAFEDPRSHIVIDDARAYFSGIGAKYDILISEPSNPWVAGISKLFSVEFYRFAARHLAAEGLLVQWVQAYEISDATLLTILRALDAEFSDYALYLSNDSDIIILASPEGHLPEFHPDFLGQPSLRASAERAGVRSVADLLERRLADRRMIQALLALDGGPVNSDFRPVLADWAPRDRYKRARATQILGLYRSPLGVRERSGLGLFNRREAWREPAVPLELLVARQRAEMLFARMAGAPLRTGSRILPADLELLGVADLLTRHGDTCFREADALNINRLLLQALDITAPFLDDARLRQMFVQPVWLACAELPHGVAPVVAAAAAYADADWRAVEQALEAARALPLDQLAQEERLKLAHLAVLTATRLRGPAAAQLVLERYLVDASLTSTERFALRLTATVVDSGEDHAPAH